MTKINLLVKFFLLISLSSNAQTWYDQNIINLARVSFPGKPDSVNNSGMPLFQYAEDSILYIVQTNKLNPDQVEIATNAPLDSLYKGIMDGVVKTLKGTIISKKIFKIHGLKVLDFDIQFANPDMPDLAYFRVMYYNSTVLSYTFMKYSNNNNAKSMEKKGRFFSSITPIQ